MNGRKESMAELCGAPTFKRSADLAALLRSSWGESGEGMDLGREQLFTETPGVKGSVPGTTQVPPPS